MTFIVRQVARRADGGDIVRTRSLDAAEITVGRGTDCDIQLADLGIMLRHARLSLLSDGRVAIEATGGIPFEIDGRFVNRADLDVATRPAIAMASHRLTLAPGEAPGSVAVTAERVIAASEAADAGAETGIFSLQGTMPGKRAMAWALALLVLTVGLALPLWSMIGREAPPRAGIVAAASHPATAVGWRPDTVWSSGPLSTAHAGLADNCGACHQKAFVSVTDAACSACHKPATLPAHAVPDRMTRGRLAATGAATALRQGLNLPEGRCASCHKEHEGPRGALLVAADFCTDCHAGLSLRLRDTAVADVPDWAGHPQFRATLVRTPSPTSPRFERVSLAKRPRENSGLVYPHDIHLSKTNSVANMVRRQGLPAADGALGCSYCHAPDSDGIGFKPIAMEANCSACHDLAFARDGGVVRTLPHGKPQQVAGIIRDFYLAQAFSPRAGVQRLAWERRLPGQRAEAVTADLRVTGPGEARQRADAAITGIFSAGGVCADCHAVIDTGAPDAALRHAIAPVTLTDRYLPKGAFVHKKHRSYGDRTGDAACTSCHQGTASSRASADVLLPPVSQCRECHGAATVKTKVAATCATCHAYHPGADGHGGPGGASLPAQVALLAPSSR
ncbi:cytochrome c3 family protein [Sandarakinorhabdus sp. DWP1-3-1]|uniref:cytochrome c3 family protein n=1 Tax=Sandarakinorhabdus sp. DWP1-3-1 TaxID=2804627 RepID=UPI003CF73F84